MTIQQYVSCFSLGSRKLYTLRACVLSFLLHARLGLGIPLHVRQLSHSALVFGASAANAGAVVANKSPAMTVALKLLDIVFPLRCFVWCLARRHEAALRSLPSDVCHLTDW